MRESLGLILAPSNNKKIPNNRLLSLVVCSTSYATQEAKEWGLLGNTVSLEYKEIVNGGLMYMECGGLIEVWKGNKFFKWYIVLLSNTVFNEEFALQDWVCSSMVKCLPGVLRALRCKLKMKGIVQFRGRGLAQHAKALDLITRTDQNSSRAVAYEMT